MKTTVIHHSADYDGIFCREIARKFLPPDTEFIGWDFNDPPLPLPPKENKVYVLDLPCDRPFGFTFPAQPVAQTFTETAPGDSHRDFYNWVWIDHHKSSIESHPIDLPGYRIDGVAACRLAWQWFSSQPNYDFELPQKENFVNRVVSEPIAVRLAGEYDVWDKRDCNAEIFQYGLDAQLKLFWDDLLELPHKRHIERILIEGSIAKQCVETRDARTVKERSFLVNFEGLKFLALTASRCNSLTFASKDVPETGHDALMGFYWNGSKWAVSLYHAKHRTDLDLSAIAIKYGGGGHRGACGFSTLKLPFVP